MKWDSPRDLIFIGSNPGRSYKCGIILLEVSLYLYLPLIVVILVGLASPRLFVFNFASKISSLVVVARRHHNIFLYKNNEIYYRLIKRFKIGSLAQYVQCLPNARRSTGAELSWQTKALIDKTRDNHTVD